MDTCRLCLHHSETFIKIPEEALRILQELLPCLNQYFIQNPGVCEICMDDIKVVRMLMRNGKKKEVNTMNNSNKQVQISECSICLTHIRNPQIFLCENNTNILRFDLLRSMLEFCNVTLNHNISDRPVMCINCWELLQISYSFKKNYMEAKRKITLYCNIFKLKVEDLKNESLGEINKYFENDIPPDLQPVIISEHSVEENPLSSEISCKEQKVCSPDLKYLKKEDGIKKEIKQEIIGFNSPSFSHNQPKRQRNKFSNEDDEILIRNYYQITKLENEFKFGYWQKIEKIWCKLRPAKLLTSQTIRNRILSILNQKGRNVLAKTEIEKIKEEVRKDIQLDDTLRVPSPEKELDHKSVIKSEICTRNKTLKTRMLSEKNLALPDEQCEHNYSLAQRPTTHSSINSSSNVFKVVPECLQQTSQQTDNTGTTAVEHESDSDDSFVDEAAPSSFTPRIKCEILSDDEIEVPELNLIDPKVEVEWNDSDNDSPPQLERMDIPIMDIKIAECYSVDVKREELNMFTTNPEVYVEDLKTCRRISFKNERDDGLFKCMQCSFETKYRFCADRHSKWHGKSDAKKKIYHCEQCPYRITNKQLMLEHQKNHEISKFNDDDIPTLYPFTYSPENKKLLL
ncbi:unnamed protein product [Phaedon cochleariae]|uniref:C2H2-type domain-containing protein n=1 Tax=Phaedon cochleariae TaxID=80249 RepID=A0A9N9SBS3_PHACE|nr:unnamed protein product [Phaedon cochleariae]